MHLLQTACTRSSFRKSFMKKSIELGIEGMTCGSCARHAIGALEAVPGVETAAINHWKDGRAVVTANNGTDSKTLMAAVEDAGYRATVVSEQPEQTKAAPPSPNRQGGDAETFDLVIIGGGSAAFAAAIKTSELGGKAVIINDGLPIGGTCVNVGCVPSKTLLRAAEANYRPRHHHFAGITSESKVTDFEAVTRQTQALVADLRQQKYVDVVADDPNITILEGRATIARENTVEVNGLIPMEAISLKDSHSTPPEAWS